MACVHPHVRLCAEDLDKQLVMKDEYVYNKILERHRKILKRNVDPKMNALMQVLVQAFESVTA